MQCEKNIFTLIYDRIYENLEHDIQKHLIHQNAFVYMAVDKKVQNSFYISMSH